MNPEMVERPRLLLAGIVTCGKSVSDIDICGLWNVYAESEPSIPNRGSLDLGMSCMSEALRAMGSTA